MNNQEITWDTLKHSIVEAAKSVCGVTKGQKRKERDTWWWSEDVLRVVKNKKEAFKRWQKMRHDTSLKAVYKKACKETKSVVAKAKHEATKHIYDELDMKEGQVKIYKIAKVRQS